MIVACVCGYCGSLAKELEDLVGLVEVQKKNSFILQFSGEKHNSNCLNLKSQKESKVFENGLIRNMESSFSKTVFQT